MQVVNTDGRLRTPTLRGAELPGPDLQRVFSRVYQETVLPTLYPLPPCEAPGGSENRRSGNV